MAYINSEYLKDQFVNFSDRIEEVFAKKKDVSTGGGIADLKPNSKENDGYVTKGQDHPNKVWGTDEEGNPSWKEFEGDVSNATATFEESSERENISTGEKLSVIFGKIAKWFADLKTVAFSGKYDDLEGKLVPDGESIVNAADGKIYAVGIDSTTPVGTIISYMGTSAPTNYLKCDGEIYNIVDYPILAQHIYNQFGRYDYWGGDGTDTFAVPDLRGEFLRGNGTASRNTGSGSSVGTHQNPTYVPHSLVTGATFSHYEGDTINPDITNGNSAHKRLLNMSNTTGTYYQTYAVRPTNTSVLMCIKYQ